MIHHDIAGVMNGKRRWAVACGDAIEVLRGLPDNCVHCCITSPPYYGLRDYNVDGQIGLEPTPDCGRPVIQLEDNLDVRHSMEILRSLLEVLESTWQAPLQRDVCKVLSEALERAAIRGGPALEGKGIGTILQEASRSRDSQDDGTEPGDQMGSDRSSWWVLRLLWGNDARISNGGSYTRRRGGASEVSHGKEPVQFYSDLQGHSPSGFSEGQIQSPLFQLQLLNWLLGILPALQFRPEAVPNKIKTFFKPSLCGECYICCMTEVFRGVKRVLRDDGTCWVNMGDSYNNADKWGGGGANTGKHSKDANGKVPSWEGVRRKWAGVEGVKPKDLMGMPWQLAFALRADGWYLRQDIIWHKPNPMPESVTDRCTKSHEYLFLLAKSARYYFDGEAISEVCSPNTHARLSQNVQDQIGSMRANGGEKTNGPMKAVAKGSTRKLAAAGSGTKNNGDFDAAMAIMPENRNRRSVWTISTKSYKGAHFATFPPDLVEPCIRAGTSEHGVCDQCGAPFVRTLEKERVATRPGGDTKITGIAIVDGNRDPQRHVTRTTTTGWQPSCKCGAGRRGAIVLDPFTGSGTTAQVAVDLGRRFVGAELNPDYHRLILKRMAGVTPPMMC